LFRLAGIDAEDARVSVFRPQDGGVQHARQPDVIQKDCLACDFTDGIRSYI